jgi:hypothetical protein
MHTLRSEPHEIRCGTVRFRLYLSGPRRVAAPPQVVSGRTVNERLLALGVTTLVSFDGARLHFYFSSSERFPESILQYLRINDGHRAKLLRDYCVNLGRDLV